MGGRVVVSQRGQRSGMNLISGSNHHNQEKRQPGAIIDFARLYTAMN